jgi:hypothetical protein
MKTERLPVVSPDAIAAALDVLHQAALAAVLPPPPRPELDTASVESLRRHVINLEAEAERRSSQAVRVDQELGRLRTENRDLRQQLAAKGGK